jgi:hypothetical protein
VYPLEELLPDSQVAFAFFLVSVIVVDADADEPLPEVVHVHT